MRLKLEGKHTGFYVEFRQRRERLEMRKVGSYKRLTVGRRHDHSGDSYSRSWRARSRARRRSSRVPGRASRGKDCADNDGSGQTWTQLKVDPNADGVYTDGTLTVTISNTQDDKTFDWSSNIGVDAVIVKGGSRRLVPVPLRPADRADVRPGLTTPGENGISHISFCYDVDPTGSLTVIKNVVNDDGGTRGVGRLDDERRGPNPSSFPGADDPGTTKTVAAGSYTVTESGGPSGLRALVLG